MSKKINRITPLNEISNMAGLTVTTALTDLKVLFNDLKEVYFKAGEIKTSDLGSEALTIDTRKNHDQSSMDLQGFKRSPGHYVPSGERGGGG